MVWFLVILIVLCVLIWAASIAAKRDLEVEVNAPAAEALAAADSCFGLTWRAVHGSGHLNYERRFTYTKGGPKPTIAVTVLEDGRPGDAPTCRVAISMSAWTQQYGSVFGADAVVLRKALVARRLRQLGTGALGPELPHVAAPSSGASPSRLAGAYSSSGAPARGGDPAAGTPPQDPRGAVGVPPALPQSPAGPPSAAVRTTPAVSDRVLGTGYQRFPGVG